MYVNHRRDNAAMAYFIIQKHKLRRNMGIVNSKIKYIILLYTCSRVVLYRYLDIETCITFNCYDENSVTYIHIGTARIILSKGYTKYTDLSITLRLFKLNTLEYFFKLHCIIVYIIL